MSHTVAVGEFEGPLGVLLQLVNDGKLEVSRVSVGRITTEYLGKVRSLQNVTAEELSNFLQLGARLLHIKSLALLPQGTPEEQTFELQKLEHELEEYRQFQAAAKLLAARSALRTWPRPVAPKTSTTKPPYVPVASLAELRAAFATALTAIPTTSMQAPDEPHLSLETVTHNLHALLPAGFTFSDVIARCSNRLEIVVTFLAILELIKDGVAHATQSHQFDPIYIKTTHV